MINEMLLKEENSFLHTSDLSFQRGYAVFDFLKVINYQPVFAEDHLERLEHSASTMFLELPVSREELKNRITTLIEKNQLREGGIRISLTGGYSADGYSISTPNLVINTTAVAHPTEAQFHKGIALITYPFQRQLSGVKTTDYLMAIWLRNHIRHKGADEVLYHHDGHYTECPRSNFFLVMKDHRLLTPVNKILQGITRKKILNFPYEVEEKDILIEDIREAKEAFITSTTKIILPVSRIDNYFFECPGPITKSLYHSFIQMQKKFY